MCAKQRQFFDASIRFKVTEPGGSRFTVHCRRRAAATSPVAHPMHKARPNGTILKKERKCRQCSVLHNGDNLFLADCCKTIAQSIYTHYSCFENMGRFVNLKKAGCKKQGHCYSKREEAAWPPLFSRFIFWT